MTSKNKTKKINEEVLKIDEGMLGKRNDSSVMPIGLWNDLGSQKQSRKRIQNESKQTKISIAEIKRIIRNPKQFMWIYGVELGYHLPPRTYVTWPYIISILQGKRKMVKASKISISISVPKLEQLSMKRIWPRFKNDSRITKYMPLISPERVPPRNYFFEILHTEFRIIFHTLVNEAKQERREQLERQKLIVAVDQSVLNELTQCSIWKDMSQSQVSKRVITSRISRSKSNNP